jgi:ADP-ribose pyrophosphatase YjhB (NUDIX family)
MDNIPKTYYRVSIKGLILDETRTKFAIVLEDNGWWELPGGGMDWPERPEECLRREIQEEMGLEVNEINPQPSYFLVGENMKGVRSINVVYEIKVKDLNFTKSEECLEMKFVSPEEVKTMHAFRNVKELAEMFDSAKHK